MAVFVGDHGSAAKVVGMVEVEGWCSVGCRLGAQTFSQLEIAAVATERLVVHIVVNQTHVALPAKAVVAVLKRAVVVGIRIPGFSTVSVLLVHLLFVGVVCNTVNVAVFVRLFATNLPEQPATIVKV